MVLFSSCICGESDYLKRKDVDVRDSLLYMLFLRGLGISPCFSVFFFYRKIAFVTSWLLF